MRQGTLFVPGPRGSLRLSPLIGAPPDPWRRNRRRRTWLWRIIYLVAGLVAGWIAHGVVAS